MKAQIHPQYYTDVVVTCTCGNKFTTGSIRQAISVEICSNCHPFYTGEEKFVDTKGTVERFLKRTEQAKKYKENVATKKQKTKEGKERDSKSLRELLGE